MTLEDIALIERIIRQQCWNPNDPDEAGFAQFQSWLGVDQDQFLELLERIPNRLPCGPLRNIWAGIQFHDCAETGCEVRLGPDIGMYCSEHERRQR